MGPRPFRDSNALRKRKGELGFRTILMLSTHEKK